MCLFSLSTLLHAWIIACVVAFPRFPLFRAVVPRKQFTHSDRTRLLRHLEKVCFYRHLLIQVNLRNTNRAIIALKQLGCSDD